MTVSPASLPSLDSALQDAFTQAVAAHRAGNPGAAEPVYQQVLSAAPTHAEARHLLAVARLQQGDAQGADAQARQAILDAQALGLTALLAKACNTRGNILAAVGQAAPALDLFAAAEKADPLLADGAFNQGTILLSLGRSEEAMDAFKRVLVTHPTHAGAVNNLGAALIKAGRPGEAAAHYRVALDQGGDPRVLTVNMASALEMANQLDAAAESLTGFDDSGLDAAALVPLLLVRSRIRRRQGDLGGALGDINAALAHPLSDDDRIEALFNKGLILDQQEQAADAFAAFAEGNALVAQKPQAKECLSAHYLSHLAKARAWFTPARLSSIASRAQRLEHGENVVFFVGFPRSGTTLMEQVLEAHPRLVTTMESSPLDVVHRRLGMNYPEVVERLDGAAGDRLRRVFFDAAEAVVGPLGDRIVVDKLPLNIVNLGLVQSLFPRAKVLVALRDPRDCVLSCLMQNFQLNAAMVNFLDLEQAAKTYAAVMGLWQEQAPHLALASHTYRYEDFIGDFTGTVTAVLDFLGVGWDPAVESYREKAQQREISTPSYRDVTAPLFTRAMGRWRLYQEPMAPVLPMLTPFARAFGYED